MKPQVVAWELGKRLSDTAIVSSDSGTIDSSDTHRSLRRKLWQNRRKPEMKPQTKGFTLQWNVAEWQELEKIES
jgi:hypothetical protein